MRRVVAETNVLVSAIQFGGTPKQLLDLGADSHIDLATSEAILEETLHVLRDKCGPLVPGPHSAPPTRRPFAPVMPRGETRVEHRDRLGGVVHEYALAG